MKKSIIAIVLAVATLVTFIIPASAWSWKTDGKFEVAAWTAAKVADGTIKLDAELDSAYLAGTKIESYPDEDPYFRGGAYADLKDKGDGSFYAYIAVDTTGMWVFCEIKDTTIFAETNTNGNDGDCMQLYFDWCTPDIAHPRPATLYEMYELDGQGWAYGPYKSTYGVSGLQYIGWVSADYNGALTGSAGFSPTTALGPDATDAVGYEAKLVDGGWACEFFIPWRDDEQKDMVAAGQQFHCGIGFQACDDADIDDTCTPGTEENNFIKFDQRKELGLSYWADYSMLADVMWGEYAPDYFGDAAGGGVEVNTADTIVAVVAALAVAGAGVVLFSRKKED